MEDSAKRRERLQAMRMEASSSSAEGSSPSLATTNTPLSNPLIHRAVPDLESSPSSHRFDYYTDPAAAYSAVKRKTSNSGGGCGQSGCFQPSNFSSPISAARPIAGRMDYQTFPNYTSHIHQFPSPNPSLYETPLPRSHSDSWRSPLQYPSPTAGSTVTHNFSRPWNMSRNSSGHSYYSNSPGGPSSTGHGESPMSGYSGIRGSPHSHSSGRGWQYRGGSPSPGWSGGRGRGGYQNKCYGLGRQQLDSFYVKSMVKDPWRKLKPIIGNILVPLPGPQSWLPKSIAAKKVKVAETVIDIKPKQNLAEFLALAFEETISNEQEGEGSILPNPNAHSDRAE